MNTLILSIHIIVCIVLILAVLLQSGKAADLAGAFGGGGSQTVFGPRGAGSILSMATTICAVLFMFTSLGLWILSAKGTKSVVKGEKAEGKEKAAVTETVKKGEETKSTPAVQQMQEKKSEEKKKKD